MDDGMDDGMDDRTDGWMESFISSRCPLLYVMPLPEGLTHHTTHGESNHKNFVGFL
jgi:hypothetical protein